MNKKLVAAIALLTLVSVSLLTLEDKSQSDRIFQNWKITFKPKWTISEQAYRKLIFLKNLKDIYLHNSKLNKTYTKGINQFTVYTQEEFENMFLMSIPIKQQNFDDYDFVQFVDFESDSQISTEEVRTRNLAATQPTQINVNWTEQGKVSAVENQGICGACYAFSAVGNMESFALLSNQKNIQLSQQQIIDCSWNYGNSGCNSGYIVKAFQYVLDNGITSSSLYPFLGATGSCQINGGTFQINSIKVTKGCNGLQNQIVNSPISVSVDAKLWQSYQSGIFNECGNTLNHAVLLTGMTNTYWIVKNSWGATWGQNGYISLSPGNTCGICQGTSSWVQ